MRRRLLAIAASVVATGLVVAADVLVLIHHQRHWPHGFGVWLEGSVSLPIWVAIGLLIVFRVPGNALGLVALTYALIDGAQLFSGSMATYLAGASSRETAAVDWFAGVSIVAQVAVVGGLIVFAQLAPDGRLASRRWWPVTASTVLALLLAGFANLGSDADARDAVPAARAPMHWMSDGFKHLLYSTSGVLIFAGIVGTLVAIVTRWRRGSAVQRQQLKLVIYAAVAAAVGAVILTPIGNALWPNTPLPGDILWTIIPSVLPASIAAAVLRYRLYDIDRVVSRTVSYAVVTGLVVGGYVGLVALIETVLGFSSGIAVAASTLIAAAGFQPLRRRVQRAIDRRFDRAAYDARRTVEAFSQRLRDEVDVETVRTDLLATVTSAVSPRGASLWLTR
jgi:hypothetical protein